MSDIQLKHQELTEYQLRKLAENLPIKKLENSGVLKQSNRLNEAKYKLTLAEQKLILCIISQLPKNGNLNEIKLKVADIAKFCGFQGTAFYNDVERIATKLSERSLKFKMKNGKDWYITHWLQTVYYQHDKGTIIFGIDSGIKDELLNLKAAYLSAKVAPLMKFNCKYSIRFYLMLKQMVKIGTFEIMFDDIFERFELSKAYKLVCNLKSYVIEPAMIEINEKSDIFVKHEYIKEGRSIKKIKFIIFSKETINNPRQSITEYSQRQNLIKVNHNSANQHKNFSHKASRRMSSELSDDIEKILIQFFKYGICSDIALKYINKYGLIYVKQNFDFAKRRLRNKNDKAAWIIDCIKNDRVGSTIFAQPVLSEIEKRENDLKNEKVKYQVTDYNIRQNIKSRIKNNKTSQLTRQKITEFLRNYGESD